MEPAASQKPKGVSLQSLFREYLNEDDSLADVELKPVSKAIEAPRPEPVQPVAVPVSVSRRAFFFLVCSVEPAAPKTCEAPARAASLRMRCSLGGKATAV